MQISKFRSKLNKTSSFMQEPFFSDIQTFDNYEDILFLSAQTRKKKQATLQSIRINHTFFVFMKQKVWVSFGRKLILKTFTSFKWRNI